MTRIAPLAAAVVLVTAALAAGCGSDGSPEAPGPALPPAPPTIPEAVDETFEDDLGELAPDSLAAGALADSLDALDEAQEAAPVPTFAPFLTEFKTALQTGRAAALASGVPAAELAALADADVQREVLAAGPDRYRRDGTRREAFVVVGYDGEGNVVAEDEAVTESAVGLVFDVVDGEYRLVRIDRAG